MSDFFGTELGNGRNNGGKYHANERRLHELVQRKWKSSDAQSTKLVLQLVAEAFTEGQRDGMNLAKVKIHSLERQQRRFSYVQIGLIGTAVAAAVGSSTAAVLLLTHFFAGWP